MLARIVMRFVWALVIVGAIVAICWDCGDVCWDCCDVFVAIAAMFVGIVVLCVGIVAIVVVIALIIFWYDCECCCDSWVSPWYCCDLQLELL